MMPHHVPMARYEGLHLGDVQIDRLRDGYPDELVVVFQDAMRRTFDVSGHEYDPSIESDETITIAEYAAPGQAIIDRLDILGFTESAALDSLTNAIAEARASKTGFFEALSGEDQPTDEIVAHFEAEAAFLDGYTSEQWIADVRAATTREDRDDPFAVGSLRWLLDIAGHDPRLVLRAALLIWPDGEVRLDITDSEESQRFESPETASSEALDLLRSLGAEHAPVVVLTEGKTDVRVLEPALRLLYPHLTDLVRFMDYDQRPMGGASALVGMVRAFASAGIANRVVALFDNDTAASDALRNLNRKDLPETIRVYHYPDLEPTPFSLAFWAGVKGRA